MSHPYEVELIILQIDLNETQPFSTLIDRKSIRPFPFFKRMWFWTLLSRLPYTYILSTLLAEMFGVSDFWLETRVIIKMFKNMILGMKTKVQIIQSIRKQSTCFQL